MTPENVIYIPSRQTTTFVNNIDKFSFGERRLFCLLVWSNFIQKLKIDWSALSYIIWLMKCLPQIVQLIIWTIRIVKSKLCFISHFYFYFLIYFLFLNLELGFSMMSQVTITKCQISHYDTIIVISSYTYII